MVKKINDEIMNKKAMPMDYLIWLIIAIFILFFVIINFTEWGESIKSWLSGFWDLRRR